MTKIIIILLSSFARNFVIDKYYEMIILTIYKVEV